MNMTIETVFQGHLLSVEVDYWPYEPRTLDHEGVDEELCIESVWLKGVEISGLMGEYMLDSLHAQLLSEKGCGDE